MISKKKVIKRIFIVVIVVGIIAALGYLSSVSKYKAEVKALSFTEVDMSQIPDGQYEGSCDVGFIAAKVKVDVENSKIQDINLLEHKNDKGAAAECIVDNIVSEQRIDVDAITGATNSSKVIKKAVQNALESAKEGGGE